MSKLSPMPDVWLAYHACRNHNSRSQTNSRTAAHPRWRGRSKHSAVKKMSQPLGLIRQKPNHKLAGRLVYLPPAWVQHNWPNTCSKSVQTRESQPKQAHEIELTIFALIMTITANFDVSTSAIISHHTCKTRILMPLTMNKEVFITCAVTGSGGTQDRSPHVPRSPKQIADSAIAAAKAGAAVVHCHVRDPETGKPSRKLEYYREVTDRIRDADVDVVLNLTAGMGGDMVFGGASSPLPLTTGTDMVGAEERVAHIAECLPEICTLDCGTMNFAEADYVMTNTPGMLQAMGRMMTQAGVKPEVEAFDTGHLWYAKQLVADGVLEPDVLVQLCMGVPWGAPDDLNTLMAMVNNIPNGWTFSAFGLGRHQMPMVAASVLAGGNVRVGLEDNLMLDRGVLAQNYQLVDRAVSLIENLGARVISPAEVREKLGLVKRAPVGK